MEKVLIVGGTKISFMISYFLKYRVDSGYSDVDYDTYRAFKNKKDNIDYRDINDLFFIFDYKNYDIHFKIYKNTTLHKDDFDLILKENEKKYDKIILLVEKYFSYESLTMDFGWRSGIFDYNNYNVKVSIILINLYEHFSECYKDNILLKTLNEFKIISATSFNFENENDNFYYAPFINLIYFFYENSYQYLSFSVIDNNDKKNLMGVYFRRYYKIDRDNFFDEIKSIFVRNNIDENLFCAYGVNEELDDTYLKILCRIDETTWFKNSVLSYTDYINSVCGLIFEADLNNQFSDNHKKITEKTLKALLFSKMNIPFILIIHPYSYLELVNYGFWFLSNEFFDFNKDRNSKNVSQRIKDQELIDDFYKSILDSINYLINLYKDNNNDLNKVHLILKDKYQEKMQNNFKLFMKYLSIPPSHEEMIDFILKD